MADVKKDNIHKVRELQIYIERNIWGKPKKRENQLGM